jgi:metallo-beta-lactamase family protein
VLIESTYGDRSHPDDPLARLADVISRTAAQGGITVMPAFAVGRAQTLLHALHVLKAAKRIPDLPFLNSPMAADVTHLLRLAADHRLSQQECRALSRTCRIVNSEAESREINQLKFPAVVVSASGTAGQAAAWCITSRRSHPMRATPSSSPASRQQRDAWRRLGAKQVKIHGEWIPVRAEVASIDGMSAHGDREDLLAWLAALPRAPRHVYVTHGEPVAADLLRQAIEERHRWPASVPEYLERQRHS